MINSETRAILRYLVSVNEGHVRRLCAADETLRDSLLAACQLMTRGSLPEAHRAYLAIVSGDEP
jgi:hypothetical protein